MGKTGKVKFGVIGSRFQGECHVAAVQQGREGEVVAIASPTPGNAERLARKFGVARHYTDYREMLRDPEIEVVTIGAPNRLHCQMTMDIAAAGKHVVCEKPLCMTLDEADLMIASCRKRNVLLMYAEELFFTPKYVKAKEMADQGAFGKVYLVKQSEKHFGPHADWFWDVEQAGGGVLMDMGCHGLAFAYWFLGRPKPVRVTAQCGTYVHAKRTKGDDNCFVVVEFDNGAVALIENSWAKPGGMDDKIEVFGDRGLTYANLHMGNALTTFSETGFGYAVEKAPSTVGWTFPVFEEFWNYGFPQEMDHFARSARKLEQCQSTGEDGRVVQELLFAAYQSAGSGKRVEMPFSARGAMKPIDLWFNPL